MNFRNYSWVKFSFKHNSARKYVYLCACCFWDDKVSLRETEQKIKFVGIIDDENPYFDNKFCHSILFNLPAILHDAVRAARSQTVEGPGNCFMNG